MRVWYVTPCRLCGGGAVWIPHCQEFVRDSTKHMRMHAFTHTRTHTHAHTHHHHTHARTHAHTHTPPHTHHTHTHTHTHTPHTHTTTTHTHTHTPAVWVPSSLCSTGSSEHKQRGSCLRRQPECRGRLGGWRLGQSRGDYGPVFSGNIANTKCNLFTKTI